MGNQQHVCYRDIYGQIQDAYWTGSGWALQQLTCSGGLTSGPTAAGNPSQYLYMSQQHVSYIDLNGNIQDIYWNGSSWLQQQLTGPGGKTQAPPAVGDLSTGVYGSQPHICYQDLRGNIQDVYWDGSKWNAQQLDLA